MTTEAEISIDRGRLVAAVHRVLIPMSNLSTDDLKFTTRSHFDRRSQKD